MGRKPKVTRGQARTTLLRSFQIEQVDGSAERFGCDFSDVIRASLDMLFPADPEDIRIRTLAAIERNHRLLRDLSDNVDSVLISGWIGEEMVLPMDLARRPAAAGLIEETVRMLRRLEPIVPGSNHRPAHLPFSELKVVTRDLLVVLGSPAVRVIDFANAEKRRPAVFLAAHTTSPALPNNNSRRRTTDAASRDSAPPEAQYEKPFAAMAELVKHDRITEVTDEYLGRVKSALRCSAFRIKWNRCCETA